MPITRRAYIIGRSRSVHGDLPGVDADRVNYRAFLRSPAGGAWDASEVLDVQAPTSGELRAAFDRSPADYALVMFLGHGSHDSTKGETLLCINDHEDVPVSALNTGSPRQLTIVDACRTLIPTVLLDQIEKHAEVLAKATNEYRNSCRALFDIAVMAAEVGISRVFSCEVGQAAGETHRGGTFSRALLEGAHAWAESLRGSYRSQASSVRTIVEAFRTAEQALRTSREPQTPVLENGRRHRSFPFAMA